MSLLVQVLEGVEDGNTARKISADLRDLVEVVRNTGRAGELTIKVSVKPDGARKVKVGVLATPKPPKQEPDTGRFFITEDGGLSTRDPEQLSLPNLRVVGGERGE